MNCGSDRRPGGKLFAVERCPHCGYEHLAALCRYPCICRCRHCDGRLNHQCEPQYAEGKFLVVRRDGTVPHWPHFVLGARDPAAVHALHCYADKAKALGFDPDYVASVRDLAEDFERYREQEGPGDPEAPPHREDNSNVISAMRGNNALIAVRPDKRNDQKQPSPVSRMSAMTCPLCGAPMEHQDDEPDVGIVGGYFCTTDGCEGFIDLFDAERDEEPHTTRL